MLDTATRSLFESRFGHDFSGVRVHTDARAAESARAVGALAYTVGRNIAFGAGQYAPASSVGRALLAHELTHVVQQAGAAASSGELRVGEAGDSFEREAAEAERGTGSARSSAGAPVLQRQPAPNDSAQDDEVRSRIVASAVGSLTVDRFPLGKATLTEDQKKRLAGQAATIVRLLAQYPDSFVTIVGHTDAVGTEESNKGLGQERADAVFAELTAGGVSADLVRAYSLGESSLLVETRNSEPRNRRVDIRFTARNFFKIRGGMAPDVGKPQTTPQTTEEPAQDGTKPKVNLNLPKDYNTDPPGPRRQDSPYFKPIPPAPRTSDPLEDALDRDPLLRSLPKWMRGPIKKAIKTADEKMADAAIDAMDTGGLNKGALKAAVKAVLQSLKGGKYKPPTPPPRQMPDSPERKFPKMPGEKIFDFELFKF
jgi:outer membrane protein OmpA-like peptidoglycan-associated protein